MPSSSRLAPSPPRQLLLLLLSSALLLLVSGEPVTSDGLLSKLDKRDRVTLTAADGTQREITVAEMERLTRAQHQQQVQMQREAAAADAAKNRKPGDETDDDDENAPERRTESLDEIRKSDPRFAAHIALAQRSFAEIQRHGYARGYTLAGFSEKDEAQKTKMVKKDGKQQQQTREDYKAALLLRAKRHAGDRAARTGTSAQKRQSEPLTVSYEVSALLDVKDQFALLAAWELDADDKRGTRLSIKPSEEAAKQQQQQQRAKASQPGFFHRADTTTWLLAAGVALIGAGVVVLYTSQRPTPVARRNSADNWELAPTKKKTKKSNKKTD